MKQLLGAISPRTRPFWSKRPVRLLAAAGVVLAACALTLDLVEWRSNPHVTSLWSGFAWMLRTLLEQSSPWPLATRSGNVVYFVVLVVGVGLVAMATGLIASKVMSVVMRKERGMGNARRMHGHIVICGWSKKGEEILRELHGDDVVDKPNVVILADLETAPVSTEHITFVRGSATRADDLDRAGVTRSSASIILADRSNPACTVDEVDAKTLLSVLAIESVCPRCYTCVEVISSRNRIHFERTNADEIIVSAELTGSLLASSAVTHGVGRVVADLVSTHGAEFCAIDVPAWLHGEDFGSAVTLLKRHHGCLPIALASENHDFEVNPRFDTKINSGDRLLVIADRDPSAEVADSQGPELLVATAS